MASDRAPGSTAPAADGGDAVTALRQVFLSSFGSSNPHTIVRAPGRVNLIGEHIDYNGYSVLPIAIEQSIYIAVGPNTDGRVHIVNHDPKFESFSCDVNDIHNIGNPPAWHDYVLCGLYGVHEHLHVPVRSGVNLAVLGRVPPAAGLSSSSALVCAAALAGVSLFGSVREHCQPSEKDGQVEHSASTENEKKCLHEGDKQATDNGVGSSHNLSPGFTSSPGGLSLHGVSYEELARVCALSEKYVGTQGGGMDQAASLLSVEGNAQFISFNPLRCEAVTLPTGACFVVANCMAPANKAATSDFNMRVVECRLATCLLAKRSGLSWRQVVNMADLQRQLGGLSFDRMISLVETTLHEEPYTLEEVAEALDIPPLEVVSSLLSKNTEHATSFCLRPRALHVFSEAERVDAFRRTCDLWRDGQSHQTPDETLRTLGDLMLASHESARLQYCCSHRLLDDLVQLSSRHALGARLTGAGWGGCTVALVPQDSVVSHCKELYDNFYKGMGVAEDRLSDVLFCSSPARGAEVVWAAGEAIPL